MPVVALRQLETTEPESDDMQFREHPAVQGKRDFYPVDPRKLRIDVDYNVRSMDSKETREHITALKASIIANGVKVPLEVRLAPDDKIYIVAGHCRHAAVMEAIKDGHPIETVPCIPEGKGTSEIDRVVNLVVSNAGKPLGLLEVAKVVKQLKGYGWEDKEVAHRLGWKSINSVRQHLDALELPEEDKQRISDGVISATLARKVARDARTDPDFRAELERNAAEEHRRLGKKGKARIKPRHVKAAKQATAPKPPAEAQKAAASGLSLTVNAAIERAIEAGASPDEFAALGDVGEMPLAAALDDALAGRSLAELLAPQAQVTDDRTAGETIPDQALIDSTRAKVEESNGWHPDDEATAPAPQSQGVKDLIDALAPFAALAADNDLEARDDDDRLEVFVRDVKRAYRAHTIATGGE